MTVLYSILKVSNPQGGKYVIVVCETAKDDAEVRRLAMNSGRNVSIVHRVDTAMIFLNDFV